MRQDDDPLTEREGRLDEVVTAYLRDVGAGQAPDREALLARHPDLAADLAEFFADQDRLHRLAAPLRFVARMAEQATPFSESATPTDGSGGPPPEQPGEDFGGYELLGEVGRGGMGVVYKARQKVPSRLVALKVIRAGWLASPAEVQRFRTEAEAAASLDHPNIVPVYEVGDHAGQPFFSARLVEGGSLAQAVSSPPSAVNPKEAARLVAQVARAVHHAHQRGILHRDLKPSNVLLDREGRPHVTDFGLAKRLGRDGSLTESGALVGTPSYMAPEQAAGSKHAATTATDVYGLGAILYALLTGRPPFRAETAVDTLLLVREGEPEPPRRANPRVDRDLETICLKCLHKDPARRFGSAEALAEDLGRWLAGEPIQARRAGVGKRLRKWVRRRPAVAALLALTVLAAGGLVAGLLWHNAELQRAAQREKAAAERERQKRQLARQAVDSMYTQVATRWLAEEPHLTKLQREFLEEALHFYQELSQEEAAEPAVRRDTAQAHRYMGQILAKLERRPEAEQAYDRAIGILEQLVAEYPGEPDYAHDLAATCNGLGTLLHYGGREREAEKAYRRGLEIAEKLARQYPDRTDCQQLLGSLYMDMAHLGPAPEKDLERARAVYEHLLDGSPDNGEFHTILGGILNNLAIAFLQKGEPARARPLLEQAIAHQNAALKADPRSKTALLYLRNHYSLLGDGVLRALGKPEEALKAAREGLAAAQRLTREFPEIPSYEDAVADSQNDLGRILRDLGRLGEAEDAFRRARALREKAVERSPRVPALRQLLALTCSDLGHLFGASGRYAEAAAEFRRILELDPGSRAARANLAWSLVVPATATRQEAVEAAALARQAVEQTPGDWACWNALGAARYRLGEWEQAVQALEKARQLNKNVPPPPHLFLAMAQWQLGNKEAALERYREVARFMDIRERQEPDSRRLRAEAAALLGVRPPAIPEGKKESPRIKD